MIVSAKTFYRFSPSIEDIIAMNCRKFLFCAVDTVSGPYSPSNPKLEYRMRNGENVSGGQAVAEMIQQEIFKGNGCLQYRLIDANVQVRNIHALHGKDPLKEAVAGACVSACEVGEKEITFVLVGDAFALYQDDKGFHFLTNFDEPAFGFEEEGNRVFEARLKEANGNLGEAWDLYYPFFAHKQFFRANRNIGKGGHSMLNGDPAFKNCWTVKTLPITKDLMWVLLGTDGMLHRHFRPKQKDDLGFIYISKGLQGIIQWRDEKDYLPHINKNQKPEASAIELKFW